MLCESTMLSVADGLWLHIYYENMLRQGFAFCLGHCNTLMVFTFMATDVGLLLLFKIRVLLHDSVSGKLCQTKTSPLILEEVHGCSAFKPADWAQIIIPPRLSKTVSMRFIWSYTVFHFV